MVNSSSIRLLKDLLIGTRESRIDKCLDLWARWVSSGNFKDSIAWGAYSLGYGNPHQALCNPSTRDKGGKKTEYSGGEIEASIERALWRYQKMDGFTKEAMDVEAFRMQYMRMGTQAQKADELNISLATYKRRVKRVKDYVETECFTSIIFEA